MLLLIFYNRDSTALNIFLGFVFTPVTLAALLGTIWSITEYFGAKTPPHVWIEQELQRCTRNNSASRTL